MGPQTLNEGLRGKASSVEHMHGMVVATPPRKHARLRQRCHVAWSRSQAEPWRHDVKAEFECGVALVKDGCSQLKTPVASKQASSTWPSCLPPIVCEAPTPFDRPPTQNMQTRRASQQSRPRTNLAAASRTRRTRSSVLVGIGSVPQSVHCKKSEAEVSWGGRCLGAVWGRKPLLKETTSWFGVNTKGSRRANVQSITSSMLLVDRTVGVVKLGNPGGD